MTACCIATLYLFTCRKIKAHTCCMGSGFRISVHVVLNTLTFNLLIYKITNVACLVKSIFIRLRLSLSHDFDFDQGIHGQAGHLDGGTRRRGFIFKILAVHLVHFGKVVEIFEEYRAFHDFLQA